MRGDTAVRAERRDTTPARQAMEESGSRPISRVLSTAIPLARDDAETTIPLRRRSLAAFSSLPGEHADHVLRQPCGCRVPPYLALLHVGFAVPVHC